MALIHLELPVPPPIHYRYPGHHWLKWDPANHGCGGMPEFQVMQWNPVDKMWYPSNKIATTAKGSDMQGWEYHSYIELPDYLEGVKHEAGVVKCDYPDCNAVATYHVLDKGRCICALHVEEEDRHRTYERNGVIESFLIHNPKGWRYAIQGTVYR